MRLRKQSPNCPYCLGPVGPKDEKVRCPRCGVVHHADCWKTNGSCSVYGCDGWAVWNSEVADRIAPDTSSRIEVSRSAAVEVKTKETVRCIKCGVQIAPGHMLCLNCWRKSPNHWFDNCTGPALLMVAAVLGITMLLMRTLT